MQATRGDYDVDFRRTIVGRGRRDMAQAGGPDGAKANEALVDLQKGKLVGRAVLTP